MKTFFKLYFTVMILFCVGWFVHPLLSDLSFNSVKTPNFIFNFVELFQYPIKEDSSNVSSTSYFLSKAFTDYTKFFFIIVFCLLSIYFVDNYVINWKDRIWLCENEGVVAVLMILCLFSSLIIVVWPFIPFQHLFNVIFL